MAGKVKIDLRIQVTRAIAEAKKRGSRALRAIAERAVVNAKSTSFGTEEGSPIRFGHRTMMDRARRSGEPSGGHNRSTISFDQQGEKFRVFTQSGYGGWLEIGTARGGKMAPRPFIKPAVDRAALDVAKQFKSKPVEA